MKVVCIGLNHSGVTAIKTLVQKLPKVSITAYEKDKHLAFLSCGIAVWIKGLVKKPSDLLQTTATDLIKDGINPQTEHEVLCIDSKKQRVQVQNLKTGQVFWDSYDKLIVSTGSKPFVPKIEGINLKGIFLAKTFTEAQAIINFMKSPKVKRVAVVGCGYVGIEITEAFVQNQKEVFLFDLAPRIMTNYFAADFTSLIEKEMQKQGIHLQLQEKIVSFKGSTQVTQIVTDKGVYPIDMVIWCAGIVPETKFLQGCVDLCPSRYVQVNQFFQTSDSNIYACGDCVNILDNSCKLVRNIGLASNSVRTGLLTAWNIAEGNTQPFLGVQGTSAVNIFGWKLLSTGINRQMAQKLNLPCQETVFEDDSKPCFMPSKRVKIKVCWNVQTRRIMGCQIASLEDHSEAIYFFSLAIMKKLTIDELPMVDLFFLPHFNKPDNFITQVGLKAIGINLEGI